jgi:hypothetical protein
MWLFERQNACSWQLVELNLLTENREGRSLCFVRKHDDVIAEANMRLDPTATTTELWRN